MNTRVCTVDGCADKHEAKGYCNKHYLRKRKEEASPKRNKTCDFCGEEFTPTRSDSTVCGKEGCLKRRKDRYNKKHNGRTYDLTCTSCGSAYTSKRKVGKYCPPCKATAISRHNSPENIKIYNAFRTGSDQDILTAIRERCKITASGCWEWQGYRSTRGYGRVSTGRRRTQTQEQTHRVTYECATGINPGEMVVHHKCANRACCNPEHLQLATQLENTAEMHARRTYEAQIAELRNALAEHDPNHPLLKA